MRGGGSLDTLLRGRTSALKALLLVALLGWPLLYDSPYHTRIMTTAGLYALLTIAVVIILGQAGQLSFGHAAFYGIGAYVAGLLALDHGVPAALSLLLGTLAAGIVALVIGRPVLKLKYFYLALATIGLGQIFLVMVTQLRSLTGGALGFAPVPTLSLLGFEFTTALRQYYLVWGIAILVLLFVHRALQQRWGRALRAIATSEIASSSLGVRAANWKLAAFVASALLCGLAGGLYAFITTAVSPNAFTFSAAILPIVMMLVGGSGSVWGAAMGAIVITWVLNGFSGIQQYSGVAYSTVMILLLMFLPAGLALSPGQRARARELFRRRRGREAPGCAPELMGSAGSAEALPADWGPPAMLEVSTNGSAAAKPLLQVQGLSVYFGGLAAVNDVSLRVPAGQVVAVIGPNGAGKTTLFNSVSRLQKADSGSIEFAGKEVLGLSPAATARLGMARTFQNLRIYPNMTVVENVLIGCHRHERAGLFGCGLGLPGQRKEERTSRSRALAALSLVGMDECAHLPAASLPYGSQRLVEIARALASEPRLLLLDEPAAGMNAAERSHLVERIGRIRAAGVTVLLIEHDIDLVMGIADQVYVLDYGRLIAEGAPEAVQCHPAVIEAYLGVKKLEHRDLCQTRGLTDGSCPPPPALLEISGLATSYGAIRALHEVSFSVPEGEVVAILGANGAGKTTLLHTISGLLHPEAGSVTYLGEDISRLAPEKITARGLCHVPEGRRLFPGLSVEANLLVGSSGRRDWRKTLDDDLAQVFELFPILAERRRQPAGTLSGGEQQMLAIGRALVGRPKLLLLDEPSMGLAPLAVEKIFEALSELNKRGLTMLMVEQSAEMALALAHRGFVLQTGSVALSGLADELRMDDRVRASYLGEAREIDHALSGT